jgi:hypothetical protein
MIVVPTLAVAQEANDQIVATGIVRLIIAISPQMCYRVDRPSHVANNDRADEHSPDQYAEAELNRSLCRAKSARNALSKKPSHEMSTTLTQRKFCSSLA